MKTPQTPANENERIKTLQSLSVLDTPPEERLDRLTHLLSNMFSMPIALVSLVDINRQWFKSCVGLEATETPREISFCGHAILQNDVFIIPDTLKDDRFFDNPLVTSEPFIRFYAGYPLTHPNGNKLGTLCLIDQKPRVFDDEDCRILKEIATLAELELVNTESATMDEETQLSNRTGFIHLAEQSAAVCQRLNLSTAVAFLQVSGLLNCKSEPRLYTQVLNIICEEFKTEFRSSDLLGRYNECAFTALVTNVNEDTMNLMLNRLKEKLNNKLSNVDSFITCELITGIAMKTHEDSVESLLFKAFAAITP